MSDDSRKKCDETEVDSLRQELREWQGRRIALAITSPAMVLIVTVLLESNDQAWKVWLGSAGIFTVLASISSLMWYGAHANAVGVGYLQAFHERFLLECRLRALRTSAKYAGQRLTSLNRVLAMSQFGLGAFVGVRCVVAGVQLPISSSAWQVPCALFAMVAFGIWLWVVRSLYRYEPGSEDARWKAVAKGRPSALLDNEYDALELKAIRSEMRDWQGRRFICLAGALTLVGASLTFALKNKVPDIAFPVCLIGLVGFFALTRYAHYANLRLKSYTVAYHPSFQWEVRLADNRNLPSWISSPVALHGRITICYGVLASVISFTWGLQKMENPAAIVMDLVAAPALLRTVPLLLFLVALILESSDATEWPKPEGI